MTEVESKQGVYGKVRVVEGWKGYGRLYVKKTNLKTYILSETQQVDIDTMVEVNGEYHFNSIKHLNENLKAAS